MSESVREKFEAAVIDRYKEGGFLEVEIRVEVLQRAGDSYQDPTVSFGYAMFIAALAGKVITLPKGPTTLPTGDLLAVAEANAAHNMLKACKVAIEAAGGTVAP